MNTMSLAPVWQPTGAHRVAQRPEEQLVVACASTTLTQPTIERIRVLLEQTLDWEYLIQIADQHKVLPLLNRSLSAVQPQAIPSSYAKYLRAYSQATTQQNLFQTGELLRLIKQLQAAEIPVIPYKGPTLALAAYKSLALRDFLDLDIFVRRSDLPQIHEILSAEGYRLRDVDFSMETMARDWYHLQYLHAERDITIEVHWAFTYSYWLFALDYEALWRRTATTTIGGVTVQSFSTEDLMLILCTHGAKHFWSRLAWVCDIAELLRTNPQLDWPMLLKRSQQLHSKRVLLLGLDLTQTLFGVALPADVRRTIAADRRLRQLADRIHDRLFLEPGENVHGLESRLMYLKLRERLRDRVEYLLFQLSGYISMVFYAQERTLLIMPPWMKVLYRVLWPVRAARAWLSSTKRPA